MKKYSLIYADPPWSYKDKCHSGKRGAGYKYPTMDINDICALPIRHIASRQLSTRYVVGSTDAHGGACCGERLGIHAKDHEGFYMVETHKAWQAAFRYG